MNRQTVSSKNIADMTQEDRDTAYAAFKKCLHDMIEIESDSIYKMISDDIHNMGVKNFIPDGYSIAQAVSARASCLASIDMIIYDGDGCSTPEQWKDLVEETYKYLLEAAICKPETLTRFGGIQEDDNPLSEYESEHGQSILSCSLLGEPDWDDCVIDYDIYKIDEKDPHGFLHWLSLDKFHLVQDKIRIRQYLRWNDNVADCNKSRTFGTALNEYDDMLYESMMLGQSHMHVSKNVDDQLDDASYEDIHAAAGVAIVKSMIECEKALSDDEDYTPSIRISKGALENVNHHLRWFFSYYADKRNLH